MKSIYNSKLMNNKINFLGFWWAEKIAKDYEIVENTYTFHLIIITWISLIMNIF